jgi:hypothetical protein
VDVVGQTEDYGQTVKWHIDAVRASTPSLTSFAKARRPPIFDSGSSLTAGGSIRRAVRLRVRAASSLARAVLTDRLFGRCC